MSGTITQTGPLTDAERVEVRRFTGWPAAGTPATGQSSWRFFQAFGFLEWRVSNLTEDELAVVRRFLAQCAELEQALLGASENLDTDQAAVWHRNTREWGDRTRALNDWRRKLCGFLGVRPGPDLGEGGGSRIIV